QQNHLFASRRRHTRWPRDWSSDVCSSDRLAEIVRVVKPVYGCHRFFPGQTRILDVWKLMAAAIRQSFGGHRMIACELLVEFRPRSEERRVGKVWRARWLPQQYQKK